MKTIICPLVGEHFVPPAKQLLGGLPGDLQVKLVPDPENPYDGFAIRVSIDPQIIPVLRFADLDARMLGSGVTMAELCEAGEPVWLGHLGKSASLGGKICEKLGMAGNAEVYAAVSNRGGVEELEGEELSAAIAALPAKLVFDGLGKAQIAVQVED